MCRQLLPLLLLQLPPVHVMLLRRPMRQVTCCAVAPAPNRLPAAVAAAAGLRSCLRPKSDRRDQAVWAPHQPRHLTHLPRRQQLPDLGPGLGWWAGGGQSGGSGGWCWQRGVRSGGRAGGEGGGRLVKVKASIPWGAVGTCNPTLDVQTGMPPAAWLPCRPRMGAPAASWPRGVGGAPLTTTLARQRQRLPRRRPCCQPRSARRPPSRPRRRLRHCLPCCRWLRPLAGRRLQWAPAPRWRKPCRAPPPAAAVLLRRPPPCSLRAQTAGVGAWWGRAWCAS